MKQAPQATPQDIENRLADKETIIRIATEVWADTLTPTQIHEAWEEMAADVRAHTPPTLHGILKGFADRLNAR